MKPTPLIQSALVAVIGMTALGCAATGPAAGTSSGQLEVGRSASGSTVSLHRGERLVVMLPANPTTGYRWEVVQGVGGVLTQPGDPEYLPAGSALGAGGSYRFIFLASTAGSAELQLAYRRPFEAGNPADTFQLAVRVSPR